jgi:glycosyltransferase involved in cell wall biosynthesis
MKILLATFWTYPQLSGVNTYITLLRKILEQNDHKVDILAQKPNSDNYYLISRDESINGKSTPKAKIMDFVSPLMRGYYHQQLPFVDPWVHWQEIERYTFELSTSLFDLSQYDLIHAQDVITSRAISRVKPDHVPLVATIHGLLAKEMIVNEDILSENRKLAMKWNHYLSVKEYLGVSSADHVIIPSQWLAKQLSSKNIGAHYNKMNIIPYGMDISSFLQKMNDEPSPQTPELSENIQFIISCPARLVNLKGHQTLIDSLSIIKEKRSDFVCWFIGDGELENELKRYSKEKGLSEIIFFLGERKDVPALLNKTDIVVLPSLQDNLPFAIMEAQAAGKPVAASEVGGIPEMITHKETGLLFEKRNSLQLAESILELMDDSALRTKIKNNSKKSSEIKWSVQTKYQSTINIYNQAIASVNAQSNLIDKVENKRNNAESIFMFEVNVPLYTKVWKEISKNLPANYTIPDLEINKSLSEENSS